MSIYRISLVIRAVIILLFCILAPQQLAAQKKPSAQKQATQQDVITFLMDMRSAMMQRWFDPEKDLLGVRGSIAPLHWDSTLVATDPDRDSIYTLTVTLTPSGKYAKLFGKRKLAYKFKVENSTKLNGGWETAQNSTVLLTGKPQTVSRIFNVQSLAPTPSTRSRNVRLHEFFQPKTLLRRTLSVYVPLGYEKSSQRYPVLYLHDGQNIFDDSTAASGEWYVDEIADMLIQSKKLPPCIIVGVSVRGEDRINEYTPVPMNRYDGLGRPDDLGGKGGLHAQMLVEEIKPFIDSTYRTLSDRANTALGGSSLGGLMTLYTGMNYPNVFGKLMIMSPSVWWAKYWVLYAVNQNVQDSLQTSLRPSENRIWLDIGDAEGRESVEGVRSLKNLLLDKGWKLGSTFSYVETKNGQHTESAWSERLEPALLFLFGNNSRK